MREIKFRAWNLNTLQWDDDFLISPDGAVCSYDETRFSGGWYNRPELVIMQYTGLKDKNGKEIWEGDIVSKGECGVHPVVWGSYSDYEYVGDIECWMCGALPLSDLGGLYGFREHENEVIGNIYESKLAEFETINNL